MSDKKILYSVVHHHRHGTSHYLLAGDVGFPDEETVIKALKIDFEPEREEFIEIDSVIEIMDLNGKPVAFVIGDPLPEEPELPTEDPCKDRHASKPEWQNDAQGIPLCKTCPRCHDFRMSKYRPEILSGYTQADVDEPIEPEEY